MSFSVFSILYWHLETTCRLLFRFVIHDVALFVVVRGYLEKPVWLNLYNVTHKFLGREDKLMVDDPLGEGLKHRGTRVDVHSVLVLQGLVGPGFSQLSCVVEETRCKGLPYVRVVFIIYN